MTKDIERIYEEILREIILMKIKPGERISEIGISNRFNISRTPTREILKRLELKNLLDIYSKSGCYVKKLDLDSVKEIIFLKESIEYMVMKKAQEVVTEKNIKDLNKMINEQYKIMLEHEGSDIESHATLYFNLDNEFHHYIYSLVGNENTLDFLNTYFPSFTRYRYLTYYRSKEEIVKLFNIHKELVECLQIKDDNKLLDCVKKHNYSGLDGIEYVIHKHKDYFEKEDLE